MREYKGKIWLLGDDIDTDIILSTEYLAFQTIEEMKPYAFSPLRPELAGNIQPGDILAAGWNFGCGSSREQAPEVVKALGVRVIIAKSYARIFYRNAVNNGLLLIEQKEFADQVQEGDEALVSEDGVILCAGKKFPFQPLPKRLMDIIEAGGLVPAMRKINGLSE